MKQIIKIYIVLPIIFFALSLNISLADTVLLKNGGIIKGKIIEKKKNQILVAVEGGTMTFTNNEIKKIDYSDKGTSSNTVAANEKKKKKTSFLTNIKVPKTLKKLSPSHLFTPKKIKEYTIHIIIFVGTIIFIILLIILQTLIKLEDKEKKLPEAKPSIAELQREHSLTAAKSTSGFTEKSFLKLLPNAFIYPFKGHGWLLILLGLLVIGAFKFLSFIPFAGWAIGIFISGYITAYFVKIINSTGEGDESLPEWPEFRRIDSDIIQPIVRMLSPLLIAFIPAGAFALLGIFRDKLFFIPAIGLGAFGGFYYPMAVLATAVGVDVHYHPLAIFKAIFKTFFTYLVTLIILGIIVAVNIFSNKILGSIFPILLVLLFQGILSFYLTIVEARILGLLYYTKGKRLGFDNIL